MRKNVLCFLRDDKEKTRARLALAETDSAISL